MMNKASRRSFPVIRWVIVAGYAALIFFLSSQPMIWKPSFYDRLQVDKTLHFVEYGLFGILLCRAVHGTITASAIKVMIVAAVIATGYAISDEVHQASVPTRNGNWHDAAVDMAGAIVGALVWRRSTAKCVRRRAATEEECPAAGIRNMARRDLIDS